MSEKPCQFESNTIKNKLFIDKYRIWNVLGVNVLFTG